LGDVLITGLKLNKNCGGLFIGIHEKLKSLFDATGLYYI
jgi:hypothetical protein